MRLDGMQVIWLEKLEAKHFQICRGGRAVNGCIPKASHDDADHWLLAVHLWTCAASSHSQSSGGRLSLLSHEPM